jgi:hypothetical protein
MLSVVMLSVVMLSVIMLNVILLNCVTLSVVIKVPWCLSVNVYYFKSLMSFQHLVQSINSYKTLSF